MKEELKYEKETLDLSDESTPEFLKAFQKEGIWSVRTRFSFVLCTMTLKSILQIHDVRGNDEVVISRKFEDEKCVFLLLGLFLDNDSDPNSF